LGLETARALAARGARITGAARNLGKTREALSRSSGVKLVALDLASLRSVRTCVDALLADGAPIDVVVANAGVGLANFRLPLASLELQRRKPWKREITPCVCVHPGGDRWRE